MGAIDQELPRVADELELPGVADGHELPGVAQVAGVAVMALEALAAADSFDEEHEAPAHNIIYVTRAGEPTSDLPHNAMAQQPVSGVAWRHRSTLNPNHYNPNKVAPPELELLIVSIMEDGWTQPIVILEDGTIVDGFHRWTVAGDPRLLALFKGWVPTVVVALDPVHRMMSTIRHNRARGTHSVVPMARIVREIAESVPKPVIQERLGMEDEEVDRLIDRAGMPGRGKNSFDHSWVPTAEGKSKGKA